MAVLPTALLSLMLAAGLALLARALRGDVVGDHPFCRRCGFDLFGRGVEAPVCPECGADVSKPRATRTGVRRRRAGLAAVALVLMLPGLVLFGTRGGRALAAVKWIQHQPYGLVLRQSHSGVPAERDEAIAELLRRVSEGRVSDARLAALVDEMLAAQADLNTPWVHLRGDIIEAARTAKKLPDAKWQQFLRNMPQLRLRARANVRRGDALPIEIGDRARCGSRMQVLFKHQMTVLPGGLVEARAPATMKWFATLHAGGNVLMNYILGLDRQRVAESPDGPQTIHVRSRVELWESSSATTGPPTATTEVDLQTTWTLVAADAPTMTPVPDDPQTRAAMEKGVTIRDLHIDPHDPYEVYLYITALGLPAPLAHDVILRAGAREWPLTTHCGTTGTSTSARIEKFDPDVVDVVFRPSPAAAARTVDLTRYWTGELVIRNVKVRRPAK